LTSNRQSGKVEQLLLKMMAEMGLQLMRLEKRPSGIQSQGMRIPDLRL
jgi:hypothetical protein